MAVGQKYRVPKKHLKTLLVKGKIYQNLCSPRVFFLIHSHVGLLEIPGLFFGDLPLACFTDTPHCSTYLFNIFSITIGDAEKARNHASVLNHSHTC